MRDLRDDREVVRDVEAGRAELADEVAQERQHLDLRRDVERGGRLVEDDDVGPAAHRHRGHGALQLAARDLVGIAVPERLGIGKLQRLEELQRIGLGLRPAHHAVDDRRLADLVHQRHRRVEGGGGALRDIGDALAAEIAALRGRRGPQLGAVDADPAAGDAAARARIGHGGEADGRLAGARLADQAEDLAAPRA